MKRIIFILLIFFNFIVLNAEETKGNIHLRINIKNILESEDITVNLLDKAGNKITDKIAVMPMNNFYFIEIENGEYTIEIKYKNHVKKIEIIKDKKDYDTGIVEIELGSKKEADYIFSIVVYIVGIVLNFIILYFLRKKNSPEGLYNITASIILINFTGIFYLSAYLFLIIDSDFMQLICLTGAMVSYSFFWPEIVLFFLKYPKRIKDNKIKWISIFLYGIAIIVTVAEIGLIYFIDIESLLSFTDAWKKGLTIGLTLIFVGSSILTEYLYMIIIFSYMIYIGLRNKNTRERYIAYSIAKLIIAIFISIQIIDNYMLRNIGIEGGDNWAGILHITIFYLFLVIIIKGQNLFFEYKWLSGFFKEGVIYFGVIAVTYIVIALGDKSADIEHIFLVIFLKIIFDYVIKKLIFEDKYKIDRFTRKIESVMTMEQLKKIIREELEKITDIKKIEIIERDEIDLEKLKKIEYQGNTVDLKELNIENEYETGLKLFYDEKLVGILVIGKKENGKALKNKEIEFLMKISEKLGNIINILNISEAKYNYSLKKCNESKKSMSEIIYIEKFLKIIEEKGGEEIKKYCEIISDELEKMKEREKIQK